MKFNRILTGRLWRNPDFMKLWTGETVSLFGSQITALALPLAAATTLQADAGQMGLLNASQFAPYLLVTLFAGLWVDRRRRLPILIGANIGRALLLMILPLFYFLGILQIEVLYGIAFLVGIFTVFFDLAYQSYLPSLVEKEDLVAGNSKLQASASIADVGGRGIAGLLISWLTAPVSILFDAITYVFSAATFALIRKPETAAPVRTKAKASIWKDIAAGLQTVYRNTYLRALATEASMYNLFNQVTWAVLILYMTRDLKIPDGFLGFIMATSSIGALLGSFYAGRFGAKYGIGPTLAGAMLLGCASPLLLPLATGSLYVSVPILVISFISAGFGIVIQNVQQISLRQAITPQHLLGRMTASYRFVVTGAASLGALLGGSLGTLIGLRPTLVVGALGTLSAVCWIFFSPVPKLKRLTDVETVNFSK